MKLVKLQKRKNDTVLTVPTTIHGYLETVEYMKCTLDENGLHYKPVED